MTKISIAATVAVILIVSHHDGYSTLIDVT